MRRILIVEDSQTQAALLAQMLKRHGYEWQLAASGEQALDSLTRHAIDIVLTDLVMPGMSGLELIDELRRDHPRIPVVVITEHGSEDAAAEALRRGAVSYIPKRRLNSDLIPTLASFGGIVRADCRDQRFLDCWQETSSTFLLGNEVELVPRFVAFVTDVLRMLRFGDETELVRVGVALTEALTNAICHGNLELSSEFRETDGKAWEEMAQHRMGAPPFCDRRVAVKLRLSRTLAEFHIRDDGPGFDPRRIADPTDPRQLQKPSGRGVLLMKTFMDEVKFNQRGNEVTMVRRSRA